MRTLNKNKQKMYYATLVDTVQEEYIDEEGNGYTTGEPKNIYSEPVEFYGNIAMSGGEAEAQEYGLSLSDYSAILVASKNTLPINEQSRIWHTSEPTNDDNGYTDEYSADYRIVKISPSLNFDKYVLKKVVK